jgi:hypothetical protein
MSRYDRPEDRERPSRYGGHYEEKEQRGRHDEVCSAVLFQLTSHGADDTSKRPLVSPVRARSPRKDTLRATETTTKGPTFLLPPLILLTAGVDVMVT